MKTFLTQLAFAGVVAFGASSAALASGDCGINSNKPCPPTQAQAEGAHDVFERAGHHALAHTMVIRSQTRL